MPIKKENQSLYPKNWKDIRELVRARARDRCEGCGVHDHSVGYRNESGDFIPLAGNLILEDYGQGIDPYSGKILDVKNAREVAGFNTQNDEYGYQYFVIICTTAHLDHDPQNNELNNLRFWCQKCHNSYDREHRNKTIKENRLKYQLDFDFDR